MTTPDSTLALVRKCLGEPYYGAPNCLIYNDDCVAAMKKLSAYESKIGFNLVVTSPPYNIGKEYEQPLSLRDYLGWSQQWISAVHALTLPTGTFWLNLGYVSVPDRGVAVPLPYLLFDKVPFQLLQEIVWNYGAGVACKNRFSPRNEKFLWYVKDTDNYTFNLDAVRDPNVKYPNQKKHGVLRCNPGGKNPSDVWAIPKVTSGAKRASKERTPHPAQFPVAVIERVVKASSNVGDIVLDPFMGSGTTAEVALRTGRCVVGFEINPAYCDIIKKRLTRVASEIEGPLQAGSGFPPGTASNSVGEDEEGRENLANLDATGGTSDHDGDAGTTRKPKDRQPAKRRRVGLQE